MKASKKFLSLSFLLILVLTVFLAGCNNTSSNTNSNASSTDSSSSSSSKTKSGGTLTIAELSDATQLDPAKGTDIPSANVYQGKIYENLVTQDKDMNILPQLATSWKRIDDLTWQFDLRQGVKFQDGTPFNADAVKVNIERILDPKTASSRAKLFEMIKEVKVVDDHTVQFITSYPFTPLLADLAHYSGGMVSPAAIEKYGDKLGQNPVGTGPFKFDSWTPGQQIVLTKNNDYWGDKPKIDKVVFKVIPEDSTRLGMVETGEAQIAEPVPVSSLDQVKNSSNMKLYQSPALGIDYVGFNCEKKPFNDPRVRQAINYAVDTKAILKGVYDNIGSYAAGPMGPGVFGYDPNLKGYNFDPQKAKQLLAEAGYPNGFKTTIWTNDNTERKNVAQVIQSQLKDVGIDVKIQVMEWGAYLDATGKGQHDMFILGWSNMTGDADYNQYFLFDSAAKGATGNRSFYSNPQVDQLINQGRQESDPKKRLAIYAQAQEIEMKDAPIIPIRNGENVVAVSNKVQGFWDNPAGVLQINNVSLSN